MTSMAKRPLFPDGFDRLPALSHEVVGIMQLCEQPTADAASVAALIQRDPTVSARVLRVANSSFFGGGGDVATVHRAVVRLGVIGVRNLVAGMAAQQALQIMALSSNTRDTLQRHLFAVAAASELIARQAGYPSPPEAFVAGLLHDIGHVAMAVLDADRFDEALRPRSGGSGFLSHERSMFGMNHAEAGYELLHRWRLPEMLGIIARDHHDPISDETHPLMAIVCLGDILAQRLGFGFDFQVTRSDRDLDAMRILDLTADSIRSVVDQLESRVHEAERLIQEANIDAAMLQVTGTAWWVASEGGLGPMLLEHAGFRTIGSELETALAEHRAGDLVVLSAQQAEAVGQFAAGGRYVVLRATEGAVPPRRWDPDTGVCHLPERFTMHDVRWLQEMMAA